MKKSVILPLAAVMLLCGCGTYTGTGAYAGATLGSVVGSAIGGITGGPRGSDIGTLVGMAGGAAVGGALGAQADKKVEQRRSEADAQFAEKYRRHREAATGGSGDDYRYDDSYYGGDDSGYDPEGRGDDVLYDFDISGTGGGGDDYGRDVRRGYGGDLYGGAHARADRPLEVRSAHFYDDSGDGLLSAGETGRIVFEVYNRTENVVRNVSPTVTETTDNKNVYMSGPVDVERILPGKGVRYTATVKAGRRMKNCRLTFNVCVKQGGERVVSDVVEINVCAARR